eukprot:g640.t1
MAEESDELVLARFNAQTAEQAERYDEMVKYMKEVVKIKSPGMLSVEERNLLSVAYKNVVGARRASWRILSSLKAREAEKELSVEVGICGEYLLKVENELEEVCRDVLRILDTKLIPDYEARKKEQSEADGKNKKKQEEEAEEHVFYLKMAGDYHRYIAEFAQGSTKDESLKDATKYYKDASGVAEGCLPPTHPIRLGLALNFSVFYFEILNEPKEACKLAKEAFDDAIAELDQLSEDSYKDATLIMQLLRDNLTLWTSEADGGEQ